MTNNNRLNVESDLHPNQDYKKQWFNYKRCYELLY